jgi:hypothetical protein
VSKKFLKVFKNENSILINSVNGEGGEFLGYEPYSATIINGSIESIDAVVNDVRFGVTKLMFPTAEILVNANRKWLLDENRVISEGVTLMTIGASLYTDNNEVLQSGALVFQMICEMEEDSEDGEGDLLELISLFHQHYEIFSDEDHKEIVDLIKKLCPEAIKLHGWE